jgi:hypothetical protein
MRNGNLARYACQAAVFWRSLAGLQIAATDGALLASSAMVVSNVANFASLGFTATFSS